MVNLTLAARAAELAPADIDETTPVELLVYLAKKAARAATSARLAKRPRSTGIPRLSPKEKRRIELEWADAVKVAIERPDDLALALEAERVFMYRHGAYGAGRSGGGRR